MVDHEPGCPSPDLIIILHRNTRWREFSVVLMIHGLEKVKAAVVGLFVTAYKDDPNLPPENHFLCPSYV